MAEGEVKVVTSPSRPEVEAKARWEAVAAVAMDLLERRGTKRTVAGFEARSAWRGGGVGGGRTSMSNIVSKLIVFFGSTPLKK